MWIKKKRGGSYKVKVNKQHTGSLVSWIFEKKLHSNPTALSKNKIFKFNFPWLTIIEKRITLIVVF